MWPFHVRRRLKPSSEWHADLLARKQKRIANWNSHKTTSSISNNLQFTRVRNYASKHYVFCWSTIVCSCGQLTSSQNNVQIRSIKGCLSNFPADCVVSDSQIAAFCQTFPRLIVLWGCEEKSNSLRLHSPPPKAFKQRTKNCVKQKVGESLCNQNYKSWRKLLNLITSTTLISLALVDFYRAPASAIHIRVLRVAT